MPEETVFNLITREYYQLTASEKKLAAFVVANGQRSQAMSISELAAACGVAEATISTVETSHQAPAGDGGHCERRLCCGGDLDQGDVGGEAERGDGAQSQGDDGVPSRQVQGGRADAGSGNQVQSSELFRLLQHGDTDVAGQSRQLARAPQTIVKTKAKTRYLPIIVAYYTKKRTVQGPRVFQQARTESTVGST